MQITGKNFLGYNRSTTTENSFKVFSLVNNGHLDGEFQLASSQELEQSLLLAESAFQVYRQTSTESRAAFLDAIAEEILALGDVLLERCAAESGLPLARLTGERGRTCSQLKLFAQLLRDGWYVDARIDLAQPNRQPLPKSDIRKLLVPIGPVAVFGASNFPLAFSTAGGDTASALAAGCPVIVKAHSSHAGTNELVSSAIIKAAKRTGMPDGVFSSLSLSHDDVIKFVSHPVIKAVGFTGSRSVGMRIFNAAVSRATPIPVFAEMSSVNPVILMDGALKEKTEQIAKELAGSVVLGAGQFCTNPGLILLIENETSEKFLAAFGTHIKAAKPSVMLNKNICQAYTDGISALQSSSEISVLAQTSEIALKYQAGPAAFTIKAEHFLSDKKFSEEVFGPVTLIVRCKNEAQLLEVLEEMEGQLTATIHAVEEDANLVEKVIAVVTEKVGRLVYGGYPTGVEVCHSMQHGGPFPSTTDSRSTSVGTSAIYRFLRPVAYQDIPEQFLPDALKSSNPLNILRLVDGNWTKDKIV